MKSIGPYVVSATPPGAVVNGHAADQATESGPARPLTGRRSTDRPPARTTDNKTNTSRAEPDSAPLHGLDRLTGMPVLLHRLPEFLVPAAIPASASLLPVLEVDVWDGQSYAVTELPLAAIPATHPDSAALGALRGLVALHAAGQVHGGLNAGQLWQIGREVRLAGAGLPWQPEAGTETRAMMQAQDLKALGRALDTLGVRPAGLDSLETMTAVQALEALETALAEQDRRRGAAPDAPSFSPPVAVVQAVAAVQADMLPVSISPVALQPAPPVAVPVAPLPEPSVLPVASAVVPDLSVPEPSLPSSEEQAPEPVAAPSRYRAADEVIVIGEAAPVSTEPLNAAAPTSTPAPPEASPPAPEPSPARVVRAPIRIGFDEPPVPLLDWTPTDQPSTEQPTEARLEQPELQVQGAEPEARNPQPVPVPHTSEAPELDGSEQSSQAVLSISAPSAPATAKSPVRTPAIVPPRPSGTAAPTAAGTPAPTVRSQPLRIGWEEDHSWRVVKSGPERRRMSAPQLPGGTPRLALLALVVLAAAGSWFWYSGQTGGPATSCCTQRFTVSGSSQPVKVTLVQAPPGSSLQPGALIGTAPGTLKFQGVPGSYTLKFSAAGHRAVNGAVRVPSEQPFGIVLK
ncbi:hypothetical protein [Deinococcus sp. UYEF24]